jgi:hypothetical protein
MTDKFTLIESIVNENAVDFRQIVNKVLMEKLSTKLDEEYKEVAKGMFNLSEEDMAEEVEEETEEEETEEETEEEVEEVEQAAPEQSGGSKVTRSYGSY